ncbi:hypothetical protein B5M09_007264, partial [Aphanomyces astaci]
DKLSIVWFAREIDWGALGWDGTEDLHHTDKPMGVIANLMTTLETSNDYLVVGDFCIRGCLSLHALRWN